MAQYAIPSPLYVTALSTKADLIIIWGQKDRYSASQLEERLKRHISTLAYMIPPDTSVIYHGLKCFAINMDGNVHRVQVSNIFNRTVEVHSLDQGLDFCVDFRNLRLAMPDDPLVDLPKCAEGYFVANLALSQPLDANHRAILEEPLLNQTLHMRIVLFNSELNVKFASFFKNDVDIRSAWLGLGLFVDTPVALQEQRLKQSLQRRPPQLDLNTLAYLPPPTIRGMHVSSPSSSGDAMIDKNAIVEEITAVVKEKMGLVKPIAEGLFYLPPTTLLAGRTYNVVVTDASDGPWSFSVQLVSDGELVESVAREMQVSEKIPLQQPIFPGKACIGFCRSQGLYARGWILNIGPNSSSVFFVDYGVTEDLTLKDIFQLPAYEFRVQALSQKFSLAHLPQMKNGSDEYNELLKCFAEVVKGQKCLLKVTITEENCPQNCELYDPATNANIKKTVNQKVKQMKSVYLPDDFPAEKSRINVYITHIESPDRFFVQNSEREEELNSLLAALQKVAVNANCLVAGDLQVGMPCMALFEDDLWYRARIINISEKSATVNFVDYGNECVLPLNSLKDLPRKMIAKYRTGAMMCSLDGYHNSHEKGKIINVITDLKDEEAVSIEVVKTEPGRMIVRVFHNGHNILLKSPSAVTSLQSDASPSEEDRILFDLGGREDRRIGSGRFPHEEDEWGDNSAGFKTKSDGPGFKKRFHNEISGDAFRKRPDNRDGVDGNFKKRFDNEDSSSGFKKRFENKDGNDGGFKKRFDNEDSGGGFKKRFENKNCNDGGFKKRFDNEDSGGGFRKRFENKNGDDVGFKKRFDNEDSRGGLRKRYDNEDNGGGFKKRFENKDGNDGGFKKRFDNEERGGGFKKRFENKNCDDGGFKKRFDNEDSGGGFKKKFGESSTGDGRPMRTPVQDKAPAGSAYTEQQFEPGTQLDVIITFLVSPLDFYVQTSIHREAFVSLMGDIQRDYSNKFSFKKNEQPQVSDIVVAKFSEDRVLYRAEIVEAEPIIVRFVDYGNLEVARDSRDVYPAMRKLLDLPRQAVRCSLIGIKPVGESWPGDIATYFNKAQIHCTFHNKNEGVYHVSLNCDGVDLAESLIAAGVAVAEETAESAASPDASSPVLTLMQDMTPQKTSVTRTGTEVNEIELTLLPKQTLVATISYVDGVDQFFCHFNSKAIKSMEQSVAEHFNIKTNRLTLQESQIVAGQICVSSLFADSWYRSRVIEPTDISTVWIQFIDYGDVVEVHSSEILHIPNHLRAVPPLAVECALQCDTSQINDEMQDAFKAEYEQKTAIVVIHELADDRLMVTLYDGEGKKASVQTDPRLPERTTIPNLPIISREMTVTVLSFVKSDVALITLPGITVPDLGSFYTETENSNEVIEGSACAIKCLDGTWRRAVRTGATEAYLVDLGRSETVDKFWSLVSSSIALPAAVREVQSPWPVLGDVRVRVTRTDDNVVIEPVDKSVYISYIETQNDFFVNLESMAAKLEEIQVQLTKTTAGELPEDEFFAARFPEDGQWYRACLQSREPLTVQFIDYGNKSEVDEVAPLPPALRVIPPLAKRIYIDVNLPDTAKETLEHISESVASPLVVVEVAGKVVDLLMDGRSLMAQLQSHLPLAVGETVFISHVETAAKLFVQREQDSDQLEVLTERLRSAESYPFAEDLEKIVAAQFIEDEAWYRGRVENNQVFFVDHGNHAEITEVRALPAELEGITVLAQRIKLYHPSGCEWSDAASEALQEFVDGRPLVITQLLVREGVYELSLSDQGLDVASLIYEAVADSLSDTGAVTGAAAEWPPRESSGQTTDDHKFALVTDNELVESNETDEQKFGKMEDSKCDDEKGDAVVVNSVVNVPDSERELEVIAIVDHVVTQAVNMQPLLLTSVASPAVLQQPFESQGVADLSTIQTGIADVVAEEESLKMNDTPNLTHSSVSDNDSSMLDESSANRFTTRDMAEDQEVIAISPRSAGEQEDSINVANSDDSQLVQENVDVVTQDYKELDLSSDDSQLVQENVDVVTQDYKELDLSSDDSQLVQENVDVVTQDYKELDLSSDDSQLVQENVDVVTHDNEEAADVTPPNEADSVTQCKPQEKSSVAISTSLVKTAPSEKIVPGSINRGIDLPEGNSS